jgi:hypothetical protein
VITLGYYDKPDYQRYYNLLRRALTTMGVNEFPYDWEASTAKKNSQR